MPVNHGEHRDPVISVLEVYNNVLYRPVVSAAFGFSCLLQEENLLFDTGSDGRILFQNLLALHEDPRDIRAIVLSHEHIDHTGGLEALLVANPGCAVYIHEGFGTRTRELIRKHGALRIIKGWEEITRGVFSTGPLSDGIPEQSLVVSVKGGFLIICGCAHPHIGRIISHVSRFGPVQGAMGGFHTVSEEDIRALGELRYVSPSHCTKNLDLIRRRCSKSFVQGGAGKIHRFAR
ncbi:MAG TPA: MBL fold metallo-hydrolase [Methanoregulaceae archaeon]|nr:MBL fold metallo-hydrolase [Methanoregulaceae archaeon]HRT14875.1 MBL fold metallo-hydrolase [Methanoregulaceae archaeon]HRU30510.1 MBL fold metallo-hydrolase [Methanoregulaceae archaeon]